MDVDSPLRKIIEKGAAVKISERTQIWGYAVEFGNRNMPPPRVLNLKCQREFRTFTALLILASHLQIPINLKCTVIVRPAGLVGVNEAQPITIQLIWSLYSWNPFSEHLFAVGRGVFKLRKFRTKNGQNGESMWTTLSLRTEPTNAFPEGTDFGLAKQSFSYVFPVGFFLMKYFWQAPCEIFSAF